MKWGVNEMTYLGLEGLLQLSLVEADLLLVLLPEVLQSLGQFKLVILFGSGVHLHHALLVTLPRLTHLLRAHGCRFNNNYSFTGHAHVGLYSNS